MFPEGSFAGRREGRGPAKQRDGEKRKSVMGEGGWGSSVGRKCWGIMTEGERARRREVWV